MRGALKPDQTRALLQRYAEARAAHGAESPEAVTIRNRIVAGNLGLVFTIWKAHARRHVPHDEVLGIGAQGLIKAVERFDLAHGVRFSTYAAWWIRHALGRTAQNEGHTIRVPVHARSETEQRFSLNPGGRTLGTDEGSGRRLAAHR